MSWIWIALITVAVVFLVLTIVSWLLWRRADRNARELMRRLGKLPFRSKIVLAGALSRDRRIPALGRALPVLLVFYLALPIDIVPDFIPVLGQIDDVVVAVFVLALLMRLTPRSVLEEHLTRLENEEPRART